MAEPRPGTIRKDTRHTSPVDGTPGMGLRRTASLVVAGYAVALLMNPGAVGRWAYILTDGPVAWAVQAVAQPLSDTLSAAWTRVGLQVPFDAIKSAGHAIRGNAEQD